MSIRLDLQGLTYSINEMESGEVLLKQEKCYDLIFLDMEISGISGMDTARALRARGAKGQMIFVTDHPDYVFEGYEVQAAHYILKPLQAGKIEKALHLSLDAVKSHRDAFFHFQNNNQSCRVPFEDILYFISDKRKVTIHLNDKVFSFYGKLDQVEKELNQGFVRIHQRYIVNLAHVLTIDTDHCKLPKVELPVSRKNAQPFAIAFGKFVLE